MRNGDTGGTIPNRQSGFTLLEILIAVAVLLLGIVGILVLFPVALDATSRTFKSTRGAMLGQSAQATIMYDWQRYWQDTTVTAGVDAYTYPSTGAMMYVQDDPDYGWMASIRTVDSASRIYFVQVAVFRFYNDTLTGTANFTAGGTTVSLVSGTDWRDDTTDPDTEKVRSGYYIRDTSKEGLWYAVESVTDGSPDTITLGVPLDGAGGNGNNFAVTNSLVGAYYMYMGDH